MRKLTLATALILGLGITAAANADTTTEAKPSRSKKKPSAKKPAKVPTTNCDRDGDGVRSMDCGGSDCDDFDAARYPGAIEVCDTADRDEDCNPRTFGERDADRDKHFDKACCNRDRRTGRRYCGTDCDDTKPGVHPNQNEACNNQDDDCDDATDEGVAMRVYPDNDHDRYGDSTFTQRKMMCPKDVGNDWVGNNLDCDDSKPRWNPMLGCNEKGKKTKKKKRK